MRSILHELVFKNEIDGLLHELKESCNSSPHPLIDSHFRGQTPLTLAITLGRDDCIRILLEKGCSSILRNEFGWSPFQEATSYGNRNVLRLLFKYKRKELARWVDEKGKELLKGISLDLQDVEFEMHWSFSSIIPFVSSICPSDTYKIYKKGSNLRIDTTLVGFEKLHWIRGNISIIFNNSEGEPRLVICDHDTKLVQNIWPRDFTISEADIEEDISVALNTPIVDFFY
jgi:ankyrin repeat domain-containing protein 13